MRFNVRFVGMVLAAVMLVGVIGGVALADEKVGIMDPQKVLYLHPKFSQTQNQIKAMMDKKQSEMKAAIDKEKDNNKKAQIFEAKRSEAAQEEKKLMDPIFKDIDTAIRTVCKNKGITVVVDKNSVFFGGIDITDEVIQELKKKSAN
ncbi:outer membrane protein [Thermanaerovibrio velox DSM 12556]|uniref:Outer membrane protein n=1 Tax=Thermanaerovibrio velox DSM 12556 TaxID=926567 RepID=H0USF0_9BACT|nr:OmpH family outer membrane protein [Thermanaerovibrio velox]EHM10239.1 outer membrane protein [Thermanaerovibrio velox DSM 12556]